MGRRAQIPQATWQMKTRVPFSLTKKDQTKTTQAIQAPVRLKAMNTRLQFGQKQAMRVKDSGVWHSL